METDAVVLGDIVEDIMSTDGVLVCAGADVALLVAGSVDAEVVPASNSDALLLVALVAGESETAGTKVVLP